MANAGEQALSDSKLQPHVLLWEFPKTGAPYLGVLIIRILVFGVLY